MGLGNPMVKEHMGALFGEDRADALRPKIEGAIPSKRELMIIEELCQAIKSYENRYVLPFTFKDAKGQRTTHHSIFISKNFRGYKIMKEIMARESSDQTDGVPSFAYNPADFMPKQALLFKLSRPIDDLKKMILENFSGQTLAMREVYKKHNIDTPYVLKNYKTVLRELEDEKKITASKHRKGTFGDKVMVTFP